MAKYLSTKTYGNDRGLSCTFRQWRSTHSHCSTIHGYSIGIKLIFESETLDDRNWVMDFGGLKAFKEWSEYMFDHTLVVAKDDPFLHEFQRLANLATMAPSGTGAIEKTKPHERGAICDLRIVDGVGCEMFAELAYKTMDEILKAYQSGSSWTHPDGRVFEMRYPVGQGVRLRSVEVFEHAANSATYEG
jgi:6-pyruvoyltetrahydropterin/6-carboxytetrahydropterin synthase